MPEIYLIEVQSYVRIVRSPADYHNIGVLEHNGCLNLKPALREMLDAEQANVRARPDWHAAENGQCHFRRGTGFEGYVIFDNYNAAVEYLGNYFDVG